MVRRLSSSAEYQPNWHLKKLSVSASMGYRSLISAGFRSVWPEILTSPVLHAL